ncbi:hypothetical protein [Piscinibacter defluvii]|uniref:hypothetical protein n=1 Tax=Piscinibacter defluvii TaxID=1796922 RepID=UPI000FDF210D|nr:hypothetical protein [Piscinibacter defluvii]
MSLIAQLGLRPTARMNGAADAIAAALPGADAGSRKAPQAQLELGGAQIVEQTLGTPVTGPRIDTLMALMAADGSGPLNRSNSSLGGQLNRDGAALQQRFAGLSGLERQWRGHLDAVQKLADQSAVDVKTMEQQGGAVGQRSTGRPGDYVRNKSEAYVKAEAAVRNALREFGVREAALRKAVSALDEAELRKQVAAQGRVVEKAKADVEAEKKRIEVMKNRLKGVLGVAIKVVKQDWKAVAEEAAKFIGGQLIDEISTSRLAELKAQLEQATARLHSLEDLAMLQAIETASLGLEEAAGALDDAGKDIRDALVELRLARKTAVEALGESGRTRGAARMIEQRGKMLDRMAQMREAIQAYLAESPAVADLIRKLDSMTSSYPGFVNKTPGIDPAYAKSLVDTVARNREALAVWGLWIQHEENSCRTALGMLDARGPGSFMEHFDRVEELLQDALAGR